MLPPEMQAKYEEAMRQSDLQVQAKITAINGNLPSWQEIDTRLNNLEAEADAMANLADAKALLKKMLSDQRKISRVVYWLAKNRED